MKKITLSVALLASVLATKAQDTLCSQFQGEHVYEFDYQADTVLKTIDFKLGGESQEHKIGKFYEIKIEYGDVLCLDFYDKKPRVRKVIAIFFDGSQAVENLDSKDDIYYSPRGVVKVLVGKPRLSIKL